MKFQPPKGTRDFLPEEMVRREYVIETIKRIFVAYGFDEIQTPVFEKWELLTKKCGEDIKQQIFEFEDKAGRKLGLRFDLTVGMARVIANNPQLPKPVKRYCIAPVWRYEEVTAGRKREFYQADIDIVGSKSMEAEAECIACAVDCLKALGFEDFKIYINNRKILDGILKFVSISEKKNLEIFRIIDKLEKIGKENVEKELEKIGIKKEKIKKLMKIISFKGKQEILERLEELKKIKIAEEGIKELKEIYKFSKFYGFSNFLFVNLSLARGLDYYTGPIFEIVAKAKKQVGSIAGGGRYDNLIELLGGRPTPATGISLGIERIIEIMKTERMLDLPRTKVKVFVANVNEKMKEKAVEVAQKLRKEGIPCQTDLMGRNLKKQLEFANSLGVPFCIIVGEKEVKENKFKLKNMKEKTEESLSLEEIIKILKPK